MSRSELDGGLPSRPWHLSRPESASTATSPDIGRSVARTSGAGDLRPAPLWRRIRSGQSIRPLVELLSAAARRVRQRVVEWFRTHPEVARALEEGRVITAIRAAPSPLTTIRQWRTRPQPALVRLDGVRAAPRSAGHPLARGAVIEQPDAENTAGPGPEPGSFELRSGGIVRLDGDLIRVRAADRSFDLLAPVDTRDANPMEFPQRASGEPARLSDLGEPASWTSKHLEQVRCRPYVLCDAAPSADVVGEARRIATLACAGVALVGTVDPRVGELLGSRLVAEIARCSTHDLLDTHGRERHSVRVRRAALDEFDVRGRWRAIGTRVGLPIVQTPAVTVLLASNRPSDIVGAAEQVARQRGVDVELVLGLHGVAADPAMLAAVREVFPGPLEVVSCPAESVLGEVLQRLTERASGEFVSKWDDDDWYGPDHLADLVQAHRYSGATLVGKAAEFVYLERMGVTLRRQGAGAEFYSTTVAGGTLFVERDALLEIGWAPVPRQVDRRLIDDMAARRRPVYRTHGFGYVLRRRADRRGHTWGIDESYFLGHSAAQWPGLAIHAADSAHRIDDQADA